MTTNNKKLLIKMLEADIGKMSARILDRMKIGLTTHKANLQLNIVISYLDIIIKHNIVNTELNCLTNEEVNNILRHLYRLLNSNYNIYF